MSNKSAEKVIVSKEGQKGRSRYERSVNAFRAVHGRYPKLGGEDSAWIRGWQSGFASRLALRERL